MNRRGFTLVEIMVTVVLVAIVLVSLAPVNLSTARQSRASTVITQRTAVLAGEVDRLRATPFGNLPAAGTVCSNVPIPAFAYTRCVTLTDVNATTRRVTVVVAPQNGLGTPDTAVFERSRGSGHNPLYVP